MSTLCKFDCDIPVKFDNIRIGPKGGKMPLNEDGTLHRCPKRPPSIIRCRNCSQQITFDENQKSSSGKKIPLNQDRSYHNCPKSPFNLSQRLILDNKQDDTVKPSTDDNSACQRPVVIKDNE
jgi:predicted RNA-binding Zn-ribbon protein involved in translation (DUF1610 family)